MQKILVTGAAGFIGYHLCKKLISENHLVYGIDSLNSYYDVRLKFDRLLELGIDTSSYDFQRQRELNSNNCLFRFSQLDLVNSEGIENLFERERFDVVINLAAQAGVRYSIENPKVYIQSNVLGFLNILEACKKNNVKHLIYASSSSVYGNQEKLPFSENDCVDFPVSIYAASKKSNELMAHVYTHLYGIKTTGLRFFTVYGPWGRPDMAPFLFTKAILNNETIKLFNHGNLMRDFTYVDDIVKGINGVLNGFEKLDLYCILNLGNNTPIKIMNFITSLEAICNKKAKLDYYPMQDGDVYSTYADIQKLQNLIGYEFNNFSLNEGLTNFVQWFKEYYKYS